MSHNKKEIGSGVIFFSHCSCSVCRLLRHCGHHKRCHGSPVLSKNRCHMYGDSGSGSGGIRPEKGKEGTGIRERSGFNIRAAATIGILFAYALLVQTVGFIIMTAVYLLAQILLLLPEKRLRSGKGILVTAAVSVVTPILIYELFYRAFSIFLPTGLLG